MVDQVDPYLEAMNFAAKRASGEPLKMPRDIHEAAAMVPGQGPDPYLSAMDFAAKRGTPYNAAEGMSPWEVSMANYSRAVSNLGVAAKQRWLQYMATFSVGDRQQYWQGLLEASRRGVDVER